MKKIKWGVLSTGKIAHTFAEALRAVPQAELYAVSSRSAEKAADFAAEYGFEKSFGSSEDMLNDPELDAVYIASPMACHYSDAKMCLNAGKNVLCEKSVTLNSSELTELLALAKKKNLFFMEAMWTKTLPHFLQAKEWFDSGMIGEIKMIKADFLNIVPFDPNDRLFKPELGGGALLDLGVYTLNLVMAFLGNNPQQIYARANMKNGIDFDDSVILSYPNAFATMNFGFDCRSENGATIVGEKGLIVFDRWFFCSENVKLFDNNNNLVEDKYFPHPRTGYEYEIREVNRCIDEGLKDSPLVPHSDTVAVMGIIDRIKNDIGLVYPQEI
ncbi:MAG: Gfo/Idh/MocA family oxidoreductase [Oscillospiraceae bacterium]|nr:Gfo/Idh/MocA family oxidoreductase [Oscillospiraceae bacterium]